MFRRAAQWWPGWSLQFASQAEEDEFWSQSRRTLELRCGCLLVVIFVAIAASIPTRSLDLLPDYTRAVLMVQRVLFTAVLVQTVLAFFVLFMRPPTRLLHSLISFAAVQLQVIFLFIQYDTVKVIGGFDEPSSHTQPFALPLFLDTVITVTHLFLPMSCWSAFPIAVCPTIVVAAAFCATQSLSPTPITFSLLYPIIFIAILSCCAWLGRRGIEQEQRRSFRAIRAEKAAKVKLSTALDKVEQHLVVEAELRKEAESQRQKAEEQRKAAEEHRRVAEASKKGMLRLEQEMLKHAQQRANRRAPRRNTGRCASESGSELGSVVEESPSAEKKCDMSAGHPPAEDSKPVKPTSCQSSGRSTADHVVLGQVVAEVTTGSRRAPKREKARKAGDSLKSRQQGDSSRYRPADSRPHSGDGRVFSVFDSGRASDTSKAAQDEASGAGPPLAVILGTKVTDGERDGVAVADPDEGLVSVAWGRSAPVKVPVSALRPTNDASEWHSGNLEGRGEESAQNAEKSPGLDGHWVATSRPKPRRWLRNLEIQGSQVFDGEGQILHLRRAGDCWSLAGGVLVRSGEELIRYGSTGSAVTWLRASG
mmetsp:Transcript_68244/g.181653  ORF Transcript_68244/g.181653 Transcript_68244/m.181653 type:complete len:592 (+) Transcript_68244:33-1808(+)